MIQNVKSSINKTILFLNRIWPLLALMAMGVLTLRPAFKHSVSFGLYPDNEYMIGAIFSHASKLIRSGHWPVWMNTIVGGVPLYNLPQFCLLYPFYFLYLPLFDSSPAAIYSIHYIVIFHIFLLEITAYFLFRAIRLSRLASVLGSVLLSLSANTFVYCSWGNVLPAYGWMLLYLSALIHLYRKPFLKYVLLAIISLVLLVMAEPPQALILAVLCTILFMGFQFVLAMRRRNWRLFMRASTGLAVAAIISGLLTAPITVPILFEYGQMIRYATQETPSGITIIGVEGFRNLPFKAFLVDQMSISDFLGIFFPLKEVKEVGSQFVGLFALTLACLGLFSGRRRNYAVFFAVIAVYSLLSAAGANLGLAYLNYHIPLVKMIREPSKYLFLFLLGVSILAAIGFDHLRARAFDKKSRLLTRGELSVLAAVIAACTLALILSRGHLISSKSTAMILAAWGVLLIFIWLSGSIGFNRGIRYSGILIFAGATLLINYNSIPWRPPNITTALYLTPVSLRLHSVFRHIAEIDPTHDYRVLIDGTLEKQQAAMIGSFYGVRTFNIYSNPVPYRNMNEMYYFGPRADKYLQGMGAKYLICDKCPSEAVNRYKFREEIAGINIYETDDAAPYYYLKSRLDGTYNDLNEYAVQTSVLPLKGGILMTNVLDVSLMGLSKDSPEKPSDCIVFQEERSPNKLAFALNCSAPHVFVLNEFYGGGQWAARVNGKRVFLAQVNGNQVGVPVGRGGSYLEIEYEPKILRKAFYPFFAGLIVFSGLIFYSFKKRPDRRNPDEGPLTSCTLEP